MLPLANLILQMSFAEKNIATVIFTNNISDEKSNTSGVFGGRKIGGFNDLLIFEKKSKVILYKA